MLPFLVLLAPAAAVVFPRPTSGLDVNDRWVYWETTPLHMAAQENQTSTCRLLVLLVADPDASDSRGRTPLHIAAMQGARETCAFLVLVGASLRRKDRDGKTPIAYTTSNLHDPDLASFFYEALLHAKECTMCSKTGLKFVYTNEVV